MRHDATAAKADVYRQAVGGKRGAGIAKAGFVAVAARHDDAVTTTVDEGDTALLLHAGIYQAQFVRRPVVAVKVKGIFGKQGEAGHGLVVGWVKRGLRYC